MKRPGATLRGKWAEEKALEYLKRQGLIELERNYRSRYGEIDLIMLQKDIVVFVEVRARTNQAYMHPIESIDGNKLRRIILTSRQFLQKRAGISRLCRFDVVTLTGGFPSPAIDWVKNAFAE